MAGDDLTSGQIMKHNLDYVTDLLKQYEAAEIERTISPRDAMNDQWYQIVGQNAVEATAVACAAAKIRDVKRVLDLPCGHGRVLRHLVKLFPVAEFFACDLDRDGVDFCASTFGAQPVYSQENLLELTLPADLDVIWVGVAVHPYFSRSHAYLGSTPHAVLEPPGHHHCDATRHMVGVCSPLYAFY